ncbi:MAG TPA: DUF3048 domain-containing protein [Streptosporangiaceae bacterium]|nr:DUF3048 domain-containing protein [Streptosporangiaceae bacterium]
MWRRKTKLVTAAAGAVTAVIAVGTTAVALNSGGSPAPKAVPPMAQIQVPAVRPLVSPFTGEPVKSLGQVLAVKIDNIVYARPQTGLNKADLVYVIPVEGGLSRFMAVFSSHIPPVIGPVRSAREDDLELLRQFGRPGFAFSGAQGQLLPVVERSRIYDLYAWKTRGYYRNYGRIAPYNLYAPTRELIAQSKGATRAHNIGFTFGAAPAGGQRVASEQAGYSAASFRFTWSPARNRWLVWMDGRRAMTTDSGQMSATTVVIQHVRVRTSVFLEYGVPPPYAESTGHGTALVLRNGKAYRARWARWHRDSGTTFTTPSGKPMNFATGPVWIVLER